MSADPNNTLVLLWQSWGPYHMARLEGAKRVLGPEGWDVIGIEVATHDAYRWKDDWSLQDGVETLFESRVYEDLPRAEIVEKLGARLADLQPSVTAINGWANAEAVAALKWCKRTGAGAIVMSETHAKSGNPAKEWMKRRRIAGAGAALVGGRWHGDYVESLGMPRDRIALGYDVVENSCFKAASEKARDDAAGLRATLDLPEHYFFSCSRLVARKNIDGLLRAFQEFRHRTSESGEGVQWHLVIAGSGEEEASLHAEADRLGIGNRVRWRGRVSHEEMPLYYGLASGFVHVAHDEAWGLVINEAAASGLPLLVGSTVGASCELLQEGRNGWVVESADSHAIADALERIATLGEEERTAMGRESQGIVAEFGPQRFGEGLLACMRAVGH